jgi:hypothetical protein
LLAYWNFNEGTGTTVNDITGNGHTGTWTGTLGSQWTTGKIGGGGSYNWTLSQLHYITVPASSGVFIPANITVSAWINLTSGSNQYIASDWTNPGGVGEGWALTINGGVVNIQWNNGAGCTGIAPVITNVWTHVAFTYDGTTVKTYVNGAYDTSCTLSALSNPGINLDIGAYSYSPGGNYRTNGTIDEVGIWNVALTATQISTLYNSGIGNPLGGAYCPLIISGTGGTSGAFPY